jgi:hypothetical protein
MRPAGWGSGDPYIFEKQLRAQTLFRWLRPFKLKPQNSLLLGSIWRRNGREAAALSKLSRKVSKLFGSIWRGQYS